MIKTFIFDLGGVILTRWLRFFREYLVETYWVSDQQTIDVFIKKYYRPYFSWKMTEDEFWNGALTDLGIAVDWQELKQRLLDYYLLQEDVATLIQVIREQWYVTVLLSDQTNDRWPYLNNKYLIASLFDHVVISSEVGLHKPDPKIYKYALNVSSSESREVLFIDDLEKNLTPAKELGIKTLLFIDFDTLKSDLDKYLEE